MKKLVLLALGALLLAGCSDARASLKDPKTAVFSVGGQTLTKGEMYNFMDNETYEQIALTEEAVGDSMKFVKENDNVKMVSYKGNIFAIEPPMFAELEVTETEPGVKGDTATNVTKPATVETGAQVAVPIFVNQGDKIQIDTRTGEYLKRL